MTLEVIEHPTTLEIVGSTGNLTTGTQTTILELGLEGTPGLPGPPGVGAFLDVVAAQDLPAYSFVTSSGLVANSANIAHYNRVVGITEVDVATGFMATLNAASEVTNVGWSWSAGAKLFLNGTVISATPPSSGFSQMVAVARNANIIIVKLEPPILL